MNPGDHRHTQAYLRQFEDPPKPTKSPLRRRAQLRDDPSGYGPTVRFALALLARDRDRALRIAAAIDDELGLTGWWLPGEGGR